MISCEPREASVTYHLRRDRRLLSLIRSAGGALGRAVCRFGYSRSEKPQCGDRLPGRLFVQTSTGSSGCRCYARHPAVPAADASSRPVGKATASAGERDLLMCRWQ